MWYTSKCITNKYKNTNVRYVYSPYTRVTPELPHEKLHSVMVTKVKEMVGSWMYGTYGTQPSSLWTTHFTVRDHLQISHIAKISIGPPTPLPRR